MKVLQKKAILTIALTVFIIVSVIIMLPKQNISDSNFSDPIAERKAQILAVASADGGLTAEGRTLIFNALSGPKMLQYNFTPEEKSRIIKAVNGK